MVRLLDSPFFPTKRKEDTSTKTFQSFQFSREGRNTIGKGELFWIDGEKFLLTQAGKKLAVYEKMFLHILHCSFLHFLVYFWQCQGDIIIFSLWVSSLSRQVIIRWGYSCCLLHSNSNPQQANLGIFTCHSHRGERLRKRKVGCLVAVIAVFGGRERVSQCQRQCCPLFTFLTNAHVKHNSLTSCSHMLWCHGLSPFRSAQHRYVAASLSTAT